jgi:hypothetical protein
MWEGLLDRRITAHENVIGLAIKMRVMVLFGEFDSSSNVRRAPELMVSAQVFSDWLAEFSRSSGPASTWLSTEVKRELNFVQDIW